MQYFILLALLGSAAAMCPGDTPCSGHGSCGTFDRCTCYRNWQSKDCSERVCPFVTSWNEVATDSVSSSHAHKDSECGSKGLCDRKSGECKCFDGYSGVGCRRMNCDDDCSGHGTCETISDVDAAYTGWDKKMITQCACDPGYEGVNCASKKCKRGDDPMTLTTTDSGASTTFQADETQTITMTGCASASQFTLTYTDWRGESWTTWALDAYTTTSILIEEALLALPNQAIPTVTVSGSTLTAGGGAFVVTFIDSLNSGNQGDLVINQATCSTEGCQPKSAGSGTCIALTKTDGTEEWNVCSDRGTCNADSGDCECYDGYTGQACEIQTIIT